MLGQNTQNITQKLHLETTIKNSKNLDFAHPKK